jgi:hypothetical protein
MGLARGLTIAAALLAIAGEAAAQPPPLRPVTEADRQAARAALERFTRRTLTPFGSEEEFRLYVEAVRQVDRTGNSHYLSALAGLRFAQAVPLPPAAGQRTAQADTTVPVCPPEQPDCAPEVEREMVIVTGSRVAPPSNPSITNNQMRGVEEGDIVKQIGRFLLVLQDGRIFVVDTRAGGAASRGRRTGRRLALTDRADIYRNPRSDAWYDEMLVFGDRLLITGYTDNERASELAVFRLSPEGRLTREGVFRISSHDYYSAGNYATRLIGEELVIYTPLEVREIGRSDFEWPVIRRWLPEDDAREIADQARRQRNRRAPRHVAAAMGPALVDAARIYRPVRGVDEPTVHTVSVCPLGAIPPGGDLSCRTTAFAGPQGVQWYVTRDHAYVWTAPDQDGTGARCEPARAAPLAATLPALLYRVPLSGARPDLIAAHGVPPDQFAMQSDERHFRALLRVDNPGCYYRYDDPARLYYFSIPQERLGATVSDAAESAFTPLPGTPARQVASRFTERYLVYGGLSRFRRGFPDLSASEYQDEEYRASTLERMRILPAYVVPVDRPAAVRPLAVGHSVIRAERVADDIVLTGYRDRGGLIVTLIDLDGRPRIASSVRLLDRYESEGRSHAFNSLIEADGSGLMGLPTVPRIADSNREHWRSRASDLSFLAVDRAGRLRSIGALERRFDYVDDDDSGLRLEEGDGIRGYRCEVSCIDWYGNSRPIFTDGRIFGLSGTELIEGRVALGDIREVQRLNIALSRPPPR